MGLGRKFRKYRRVRRAQVEITGRDITPRPHGLEMPLIVSLTSFPPRFGALDWTLKALLRQSVKPDALILWLAEQDVAQLPEKVRALQAEGLEVRTTRDIRSYKKIIPQLRATPEAAIITADDDLFYPADWLESLVRGSRDHPGDVIAHRVHRIAYGPQGEMESYDVWQRDVVGARDEADLFATSGAGVLYPPGALHPDVLNEARFMALCPQTDDLWLYWMARRQGTRIRHTGTPFELIEWPGSQRISLKSVNLGPAGWGGNDVAIAALTADFGPPPR